MKNPIIITLLSSITLLANTSFSPMGGQAGMPGLNPPNPMEPKISIHNEILAKINDKPISVMDVIKEMDMIFLNSYPDLVDSPLAKYQFYTSSWKHVLNQMINKELMILDSVEKQLQISEGEVREEMEKRFGPNIMQNLEKINLTFDEAKDLTKKDLVVQRMSWYFIHQKALQGVTPEDIRFSYEKYLIQNPPKSEWTYQVITIQADELEGAKALTEKVNRVIEQKKLKLSEMKDEILTLANEAEKIKISKEYVNNSIDVSSSHKKGLISLLENQYSKPLIVEGRANLKPSYRIFYLKKKTEHEPPSFQEMTAQLKNELVQKLSATKSAEYISKLRKHYGFEGNLLLVPEDFNPFEVK